MINSLSDVFLHLDMHDIETTILDPISTTTGRQSNRSSQSSSVTSHARLMAIVELKLACIDVNYTT